VTGEHAAGAPGEGTMQRGTVVEQVQQFRARLEAHRQEIQAGAR
jgi:hypothetical protein